MYAQRSPAAFGKHCKIATRLRGFHYSKGILLLWHWQINGVIARYLQEHAAVWSAFIGLARRVQEARPKSQNRGDFLAVAHPMANSLQRVFIRLIHCDVAQHSEIISSLDSSNMFFQGVGKRSGSF